MANSEPHRTAIGKPDASTRFTTRLRLGGQFSEGPSTVFDQSFAPMSADISERAGIECWAIIELGQPLIRNRSIFPQFNPERLHHIVPRTNRRVPLRPA